MARTPSEKKLDRVARNKVHQTLTANGISKRIIAGVDTKDLLAVLSSGDSVRKQEADLLKILNKDKKSTDKKLVSELKKTYIEQFEHMRKVGEEFTGKEFTKFTKKAINDAFEKDMQAVSKDKLIASGGGTPKQMYDSTWRKYINTISDYPQRRSLADAGNETIETPKKAVRDAKKRFDRDMESSVRTTTYSLISKEEDRLYNANSDIIRGIMFAAVLDGRTTHFCKSIDGTIVELSDPMRAPFHVNCRTLNVPVFHDETDEEAQESLDYRSRVGAGPDYEEGGKAADKKATKGNTGLRLVKNPDGSYKRDSAGNYIREPIPGAPVSIKSTQGRKGGPSGSYGHFLRSQMNTTGGPAFVRDALGKRRGDEFMRRVRANPTKDAQDILNDVLKTPLNKITKPKPKPKPPPRPKKKPPTAPPVLEAKPSPVEKAKQVPTAAAIKKALREDKEARKLNRQINRLAELNAKTIAEIESGNLSERELLASTDLLTRRNIRMAELEREKNIHNRKFIYNTIRPAKGGTLKIDRGDIWYDPFNAYSDQDSWDFNRNALADMIHKDVLDKLPEVKVILQAGKRAHYKNGKAVIRMGDDFTNTFIHEYGHHIEYYMPGYYEKALAFRKARTVGESLKNINGTSEKGYHDKFFNQYVGRKYNFESTEIISMGLEQMYKDPLSFYEDDPEYFDLILKVMWGEL